jgi:hypothetical protein
MTILSIYLGCTGVPPRRSRRATAELRAAPSLEALMQLLVARAKLLLSLRSVVQAQRHEQVRPSLPVQPLCCALHLLVQGPFKPSETAHRRAHTGGGECGLPQACGSTAKPSASAVAFTVHFQHRSVHSPACSTLMSVYRCDCRQSQRRQKVLQVVAAVAAAPGQRPRGSRAPVLAWAAAAAPASKPWTSCTSWHPWTSRRAATAAAPAKVCRPTSVHTVVGLQVCS